MEQVQLAFCDFHLLIYRSYPFSSLEGITLIIYVPKENSLSFDLVITPYYLKGY